MATSDDDYVPSSSQDDHSSSTDRLLSESYEDDTAEEDGYAPGEPAPSYSPECVQEDDADEEGLLFIPSKGDEYAGLEEQLALLFQLSSSPEPHPAMAATTAVPPPRQQVSRPAAVSKRPVKMTDIGYRQSTTAMAAIATSKSASRTHDYDDDGDEYLDEHMHIGRRRRRRPGVRGRPRRRTAASGLFSGSKPPMLLPPAASLLMGAANEAYVKREYERALEALREVIRWVPSLPTAYHLAGLCYDEQGETTCASNATKEVSSPPPIRYDQSSLASCNNNDGRSQEETPAIKRRSLIEKAVNYYLLAAHLDPANVERWMRVHALLVKLGAAEHGGDPVGAYRQQAIYALSRAIKSAISASAKTMTSLRESASGDRFSDPEEDTSQGGDKRVLEMVWERARLWAELQNPLRSIASLSYPLARLAAVTADPGEAYEHVLRVAALGLTLPCVRQVTALMLTRCFPYSRSASGNGGLLLSHRLVQLVLSMWTRRDVIDEVTHGLSTATHHHHHYHHHHRSASGGDRADTVNAGTAWASPTAVDPRLRVVEFVESHVHVLASISRDDSALSYSSSPAASSHSTGRSDAPKEGSHRWFLLSDEERRRASIAMLPNAIRIRYYLAVGDEFPLAARLLDDLLQFCRHNRHGGGKREELHHVRLLIQLVAEEHYQRHEYDKCLDLLLSTADANNSSSIVVDDGSRHLLDEWERLVLSPASNPTILAAECMLKTGAALAQVIAFLTSHFDACRQAALLASDLYKQLGDTEGALRLLYQTNPTVTTATTAATRDASGLEQIFGAPLHMVDPALLITTNPPGGGKEDAGDRYVTGTGILKLAYGFAPPPANRTTTRSAMGVGSGDAIAGRRKRRRVAVSDGAAGSGRIELDRLALFAPFLSVSPSSSRSDAVGLFDAMTVKKLDLLYTTRRIDEHLSIGIPLLRHLLGSDHHHSLLFPERPNEQQQASGRMLIGSASIPHWSSLFLQTAMLMAQKYIDSPAFYPLLERDLLASTLLPLTEHSILSRCDPIGYHAALLLIASRLAERMPESVIAARAFFGAARWFFRQHAHSLLSPTTSGSKSDDGRATKSVDRVRSIGCCTPLNLLIGYFPRQSRAARHIYHEEPYFGRFLRRRAIQTVHSATGLPSALSAKTGNAADDRLAYDYALCMAAAATLVGDAQYEDAAMWFLRAYNSTRVIPATAAASLDAARRRMMASTGVALALGRRSQQRTCKDRRGAMLTALYHYQHLLSSSREADNNAVDGVERHFLAARIMHFLGRMTEAVAHYRHVLRLASTAGRGSVDEDRLDGWRAEAEVGLGLAARHLAATCRQNYGSCNSVDDLLSRH